MVNERDGNSFENFKNTMQLKYYIIYVSVFIFYSYLM
jgi:hypothetical protein